MVEPAARIPRRWYDVVLDVLAVAGVVALLAFPIAALASVSPTSKVVDADIALPPLGAHPARGQPLRDLPVFTPDGTAARAITTGQLSDRAALKALIAQQTRAVLGEPNGGALLKILAGCIRQSCAPTNLASEPIVPKITYPFRFPSIERILDAALGAGPLSPERAAAVNDLAGLLTLNTASSLYEYSNTDQIAFALYNHARGAGACAPQLNLAMMTASNPGSQAYDITVAQFHQADHDCAFAHDPTPLWMLGQYQSVAGHRDDSVKTFQQLQRRWPGSVLGWSGEADALTRDAHIRGTNAPFTARADSRRAVPLYLRARHVGASHRGPSAYLEDTDPGLAAGEARARSQLGDFSGAVKLDRTAIAEGATHSRSLRFQLIDDLERGARAAPTRAERTKRFSEAADAARETADTLSAPDGSYTAPRRGEGLFASGVSFDDAAGREDAGPLSVGESRLRPATFLIGSLGSTTVNALPFTGAVEDISFIPQFRDTDTVEVGGYCRDLILAGRASEVLTDPHRSCGYLAKVAGYELSKSAPAPTADTLDLDQNLWRFAGDFERAAAAANARTTLEPKSHVGPDQAGEIAYLRRDYSAAVTFFQLAATRAQSDDPGPCGFVKERLAVETAAEETLKQGTALEMEGQLARAAKALHDADRAAGTLIPAKRSDSGNDCGVTGSAKFTSYNARLQLGDTALRSHTKEMSSAESKKTFEEAESRYSAARERQHQLDAGFRAEVLDNNDAIVLEQLGERVNALRKINAAVAIDPQNPIFLENKGYIQEERGQRAAAAKSYAAALTSDPSAYQAANDLGVIRAQDGDLPDAAAAFRQAIGAKHQYATPEFGPFDHGRTYRAADALHRAKAADTEYPIAEFNLGLVLGRMGPTHVLESQGEFAAAMRGDPELREHDHELIRDDETVFTTLDLSKPLPPEWHLASAEQRTPVTVAGVVFAILLVTLLKTVAEEELKDKATEEALEAESRRLSRIRRFSERIPGAVAIVAVVAVFAYPLARSSGTTGSDYLLIGAGIAITTLAFMRLRSAMARRGGVTARHYANLPAVLIGGAATLVTFGYAPMPATKNHESLPGYARWLATGLLGALTVTLLVVGRLSGVPLARHLGEASLVMTASALIPIKPYDGAYLEKRHLGLLVALALTGVAVLVELRVL